MNLIKRRQRGDGQERELARPTSMFELRSEIDDLFNRFFHEPFGFGLGGRLGELDVIEPVVDVSQTDSHVVVKAEIPGVDPEKIDVSVAEDSVTISGEKEESFEKEEGNCFRSERRFGSFQRTIPLPSTVDPDGVDAKFKNGVLRIEMKKTAPTHSKKISVKAG